MSDAHAPADPLTGLVRKLIAMVGSRSGDSEISNAAMDVYAMRPGGVAAAFILQVVVAKLIGVEQFGIFAFA